MPAATRKRKAPASTQEQQDPKKQSKAEPAAIDGSNIIGGLKGDYRITGTESTSQYASFTIQGEKDKAIPCQAWNWTTASSPEPKSSTNDATPLIFTHGAGGGLENPATKLFGEGYASTDHASVISFQGTMNLSSRVKSFESIITYVQSQSKQPERQVAVGGRSMGARAAVMVAASRPSVKKIVAVSYPLTSPSGQVRDEILLSLPADKSVLFISGSQDSMCKLEDLRKVMKKMKAKATLVTVEGADHGMSLSLTGLGLKKEKKDDVIRRFRLEGGRCAREWVRFEGSVGDGSRIDYDVARDRVATEAKRDSGGKAKEITGPEEARPEEDESGEGNEKAVAKKQGVGSKQGRRGGGTKKEKPESVGDVKKEPGDKKKRKGR